MPKFDRIVSLSLLLIAILGIVLNFALPQKKAGTDPKNTQKAELNALGDTLSDSVKDKILLINVSGVIDDQEQNGLFGIESSPASKARALLSKALKDEKVKGVFLRINSPGGTVGISQEIYALLMKLREKKIPIVVSMGDVAASGGYYIAAPADQIFANAGTITGSIGVIAQNLNYQGLFAKIGLADSTFKAGKYKDLGSGSRPMTEPERKILQGLIDDTYDQFISDVFAGRKVDNAGDQRKNLTKEYIAQHAEGLIYSGRQALAVGLVDRIGGYDEAIASLQKLIVERGLNSSKEDLPVVKGFPSNNFQEALEFSLSGFSPIKPAKTSISLFASPELLKHPVLVVAPTYISGL